MQNQLLQSWVNGDPSSSINVADRGFCYGQGVFETLRIGDGQAPLLELHLARLCLGAEKLGIRVEKQQVQDYLNVALNCLNQPQAIIKLTVTAGVGARGYKGRATEPCYLVQLFSAADLDSQKIRQGVKLHLCRYPLPENPLLAGIKHLNRLDQVLAAREFEFDNFDDGLMSDASGNPIESVSRNIFFKTKQGWVTPLLDRCGVAGVMRQYLIQHLFPLLGFGVSERSIDQQQMLEASEVFVCNSVSGIWPVIQLADKGAWQLGADTKLLIDALGEQLACFSVE